MNQWLIIKSTQIESIPRSINKTINSQPIWYHFNEKKYINIIIKKTSIIENVKIKQRINKKNTGDLKIKSTVKKNVNFAYDQLKA